MTSGFLQLESTIPLDTAFNLNNTLNENCVFGYKLLQNRLPVIWISL
jgi:hypothetical protein